MKHILFTSTAHIDGKKFDFRIPVDEQDNGSILIQFQYQEEGIEGYKTQNMFHFLNGGFLHTASCLWLPVDNPADHEEDRDKAQIVEEVQNIILDEFEALCVERMGEPKSMVWMDESPYRDEIYDNLEAAEITGLTDEERRLIKLR